MSFGERGSVVSTQLTVDSSRTTVLTEVNTLLASHSLSIDRSLECNELGSKIWVRNTRPSECPTDANSYKLSQNAWLLIRNNRKSKFVEPISSTDDLFEFCNTPSWKTKMGDDDVPDDTVTWYKVKLYVSLGHKKQQDPAVEETNDIDFLGSQEQEEDGIIFDSLNSPMISN